MDDARHTSSADWPTPAAGGTAVHAPRTRPRQFLVIFAATLALGMLFLLPGLKREETHQSLAVHEVTALSAASGGSLPAGVTAGLPANAETVAITYPEARLWAGKLLLIDREHPIPAEAPAPNTFGILRYSTGRLTCRDVTAVTSEETLKALDELFAFARRAKINLFTIFAATRSEEAQRNRQIDRFTVLAGSMSLPDALAQALKEIPDAACSEHQQGWCVDIRICDAWNRPPRNEPLSASEEGRWLLENCWRFGFLHRWEGTCADPDEAYHFRFVGKAHAAMAHALDVSFEDYLLLLRAQGALTLWHEDGTPYVTVLCAETPRTLTVSMPLHTTTDDVSMDNTGWAAASYVWEADK